MKRLLTLSALATALFFAQPAQAQQQGNQTDTTSMNHMEMMQDSTMHNGMMGMCMKMCMNNMMQGDMDMDMNMDHMQKNRNDEKDDERMNENEG